MSNAVGGIAVWALGLTLSIQASFAANSAQPAWAYVPPLISNGGLNRQLAVDLDGDGIDEIVVAGRGERDNWPSASDGIAVLEGDSAVSGGVRRVESSIVLADVALFREDDLFGFAGPSILTFSPDATRVLRGKELTAVAHYPASPLPSLVGDLEGNGRLESVVPNGGGTMDIFDVESGEHLRSSPALSLTTDIAIGPSEGGSTSTIIIGGNPLQVLDALTFATVWTYAGQGSQISVGHGLNDGGRFVFSDASFAAIVVGGSPLTVEARLPAPQTSTGYRYELADIDGDGRSELLRFGAGESVDVIDSDTLQNRFSLAAAAAPYGFLVARLYDAATPYLVSFGGLYSPDPQSSMQLVAAAPDAEPTMQAAEGPSFSRLAVGDIDDDGVDEVVVASSEESGQHDVVRVLTRATGFEDWSLRLDRSDALAGPVQALALARTAAGGPRRIFVQHDYSIAVVDGLTRRLIHTMDSVNPQLAFGSAVMVIRSADIDDDGREELLVGVDARLLVVDPVTSAIRWQTAFNDFVTDVQIAAPDGSGFSDVIVAQSGHLDRVSTATHQSIWSAPLEGASRIGTTVAAYVGQGQAGPEVAAGFGNTLVMFDAASGEPLRTFEPYLFLSSIAFLAAPADRADRLVMTSYGGLQVFDAIAGTSTLPLTLGSEAGLGNNAFLEHDAERSTHAIVIGSDAGVSAFTLVDHDGIFANGFEG